MMTEKEIKKHKDRLKDLRDDLERKSIDEENKAIERKNIIKAINTELTFLSINKEHTPLTKKETIDNIHSSDLFKDTIDHEDLLLSLKKLIMYWDDDNDKKSIDNERSNESNLDSKINIINIIDNKIETLLDEEEKLSEELKSLSIKKKVIRGKLESLMGIGEDLKNL